MKRLFLWILVLVSLGACGIYGVVLFATDRAAKDVFRQMTSVYDEPHVLLPGEPSDFPSPEIDTENVGAFASAEQIAVRHAERLAEVREHELQVRTVRPSKMCWRYGARSTLSKFATGRASAT